LVSKFVGWFVLAICLFSENCVSKYNNYLIDSVEFELSELSPSPTSALV